MLLTILTSFLVILSFLLIISIPVILATPNSWETLQGKVYNLASLWSSLVLIIGFVSLPNK